MTGAAQTPAWQRLLCDLPPPSSGSELILRVDGRGATATLRRDGAVPRVFLAESAGLRELFPADDEGLPGSPLLAAPELLAATLRERVGALAASQVVAWRPSRRAVVRLHAADGTVFWLKLLDRKSYRRAKRTFAALGHALAPLQLAMPTALLDEHCACLAPTAPGRSLRELLACDDQVPLATTARALLALTYTEVTGELPLLDFARARAASTDMVHKGMARHPELAGLAEALARVPEPPTTTPGFVHGDLHDKQMFVDERGATLIDLEGAAVGDPRFDLANLAEHVRLRDLQQHGVDRGLADHLLARCGLDASESPIRAFRAVVRARLCGVYALRPRWSELVARLHAETLSMLENLS